MTTYQWACVGRMEILKGPFLGKDYSGQNQVFRFGFFFVCNLFLFVLFQIFFVFHFVFDYCIYIYIFFTFRIFVGFLFVPFFSLSKRLRNVITFLENLCLEKDIGEG